MGNRYTLQHMVMESKATLRNDGLRRRTSGFRYWILTPFAFIFVYVIIAWFAFIGLSDVAERLRAKWNRRTSR